MAHPTNTQFALAVHTTTLLGGAPHEVLSSEVLAGSAGASPVHVRRVLGLLRTAGLVASRPGVHGGWLLAVDPSAITLADVWRAVQGADPVLGLHGAAPDCTVGQRIQGSLVAIDRRAAHAIEAELEQITICDLVRDTSASELRDSGRATPKSLDHV
jgi:Rrf2 family protein